MLTPSVLMQYFVLSVEAEADNARTEALKISHILCEPSIIIVIVFADVYVFLHTTKTPVLPYNRLCFQVQVVGVLNQF